MTWLRQQINNKKGGTGIHSTNVLINSNKIFWCFVQIICTPTPTTPTYHRLIKRRNSTKIRWRGWRNERKFRCLWCICNYTAIVTSPTNNFIGQRRNGTIWLDRRCDKFICSSGSIRHSILPIFTPTDDGMIYS